MDCVRGLGQCASSPHGQILLWLAGCGADQLLGDRAHELAVQQLIFLGVSIHFLSHLHFAARIQVQG